MKNFSHYPRVSVQFLDYVKLYNWYVPNQTMPFWRFYWNDNERSFVECNGQKKYLRADRFYLIPGNTQYCSGTESQFNHFYIHFGMSWRYTPGVYDFVLTPLLESLIQEVIKQFQRHDERGYAQAALVANTLISNAITCLPFSGFSIRVSNRLESAVRYIRQNAKEKITNEDLAKLCGMNTSAFVRKFSEFHGVSPHRFLNMVRCNKVNWFLENTELSMDEIAQKVGFCDRYHLSRVYKSIRKISPGAHRNQFLSR
jgi:AraC-like DNA-binding protein